MNQTNKLLMAALSLGSVVASAQQETLPRGPDVGTLAANCQTGPFRRVSKAGPYNQLCSVMSDSEKCLAFIKDHFELDGSHRTTFQPEKLRFCLDTLEQELIED